MNDVRMGLPPRQNIGVVLMGAHKDHGTLAFGGRSAVFLGGGVVQPQDRHQFVDSSGTSAPNKEHNVLFRVAIQ